MRASLYVRLSREAGSAQTGLASQEADLRALAGEHGLEVVAVHADDGWSGDRRDRPAFRAWLEDARSGRVSVLMAYHLDRVSRGGLAGLAEFLDVLDGRDRAGVRVGEPVRFLSSSDRLDSASPDWTIRVSVMAGLARAERERMAERARRAHAARKSAGRWSGGVVPYGFRVVPLEGGGKVLEAEPVEVEALREAGRRLVAGESLGRVARWLDAHGPAPRRAERWSRMTVRQALTGHAAGLFTVEERRAFAAAANPGGPGRAPGRAPARLLSGLLRCGSCGRVLRVSSVSAGPVYRCAAGARNDGGPECAGGVTLFASGGERVVSEAWLAGWGQVGETVAERVADSVGAALAVAEERVEVLAPVVLEERGAARVAALAALEEAEAERDRLAALPVSRVLVLRETGRTFGDAWSAGTVEDRRDLLAETVGSLTVIRGVQGRRIVGLERFADGWRFDPGADR